MKSLSIAPIALGLALSLAAPSANAFTFLRTYHVGGSGFVQVLATTAASPVDPATLNVTVAFDPTVNSSGLTAGLTVVSTNLPGAFQYGYTVAGDVLTIGTQILAGGSCALAAGDSCVTIAGATAATPTVSAFTQVTSGVPIAGVYTASSDGVLASPLGAVPEPAAWTMMLLGVAGLGGALRARRGARLA